MVFGWDPSTCNFDLNHWARVPGTMEAISRLLSAAFYLLNFLIIFP